MFMLFPLRVRPEALPPDCSQASTDRGRAGIQPPEATPAPKPGEFQATLKGWLQTERHLPKAQRRTARRLFEGLQAEGYRGAYDSVQRFVKQWKASQTRPAIKDAFVPLVFAPGEVGQFDWSHEHVEINGVMQTIKVAHFRLAHSRQMFVVAYPRETLEMVLDAHNRAFALFGGVPVRMIYDNLKTVINDRWLADPTQQSAGSFQCYTRHSDPASASG